MTITEQNYSFRFRDWDIYKDSRLFRIGINKLLKKYPAEEKYVLADQTKRALNSHLNGFKSSGQQSMVNSHRLSKGFTLIELIIAIAMLALISAVSISNFRQGEQQKRLTYAAENIVNAVRNAQNFTLTSKQIQDSECSIGVINDKAPASYILVFSDAGSTTLYGMDKCGTAHPVEVYELTDRTRFQAGGFQLAGTPVATLQLKFTPPFGVITASTDPVVNQGVFDNFTTVTIAVETTNGSVSKTVTVDGISGRIGE